MKAPLKLFVFIDALGWDISQRHNAFPSLQAYRSPARTVLGYSCSCIPSILSGKLPQEHGHWTFFYKAQKPSSLRPLQMLNKLPKTLSHHHRFRQKLSQAYAQFKGFSGYFNLYNLPYDEMDYFDYVEQRDLFSTKLSDIRTIFHDLEDAKVPYYCADWRASEEDNVANFLQFVKQKPCDWAFLYFPRLDGIMHQKGPEGAHQHLRWYESQIQHIMDTLTPQREVHLTVFSDHGMTRIHKHLNIGSIDGSQESKIQPHVRRFYDATLARYWFTSEQARNEVKARLQRCQDGKVMEPEDLKREGVWFEDQRFGELIFLANPGVLLYPNQMGEHPPRAMHGYAPEDRDSWASVLSNRPETADILGKSPGLCDYYKLMRNGINA